MDGGQGDGEMGGGTYESEDFLSLIFRLEHYRAYEKSDFTENLDERDGQWKFLILHKIYSELSLKIELYMLDWPLRFLTPPLRPLYIPHNFQLS